MQVLAISGSLRSASSHSALLRAAARLTAKSVGIWVYDDLANLPPFNPDLDWVVAPPAVTHFRAALQQCDAVLISTPEYAHGMPGVLKNALDWVVGSGELIDKPVALVNASSRATHARAALTETLTVMSAKVIPEASITIPLAGRNLDTEAILADSGLVAAIHYAVVSLAIAARAA